MGEGESEQEEPPAAAEPVDLRNPLTGILLKILSVVVFVGMSTCIKAAGALPAGQIVFFRSFFAVFPILAFLAWRRELHTALETRRPLGHLLRGLVGVFSMGFGFFALTRLPLPEAITLNYAQPLLVVVFSALFLGERIRIYRWSAVAIGLFGVLVISWPSLTLFATPGGIDDAQALGVAAALVAAGMSAVALLLVRNLVRSERTATIVLWFSLTASLIGLLTAAVRLGIARSARGRPAGRSRHLRWHRADPDDRGLPPCRGLDGGAVRVHLDAARPSRWAMRRSATSRRRTRWQAAQSSLPRASSSSGESGNSGSNAAPRASSRRLKVNLQG